MNCLNPGGYFKRSGYSLESRTRLFYLVCIPLRITLALLVYYLMQMDRMENEELNIAIPSIIIPISAYTIVNGLTCLWDKVWWSRGFEMAISLVLIIMSAVYLQDRSTFKGEYLAIPIFIDILFGYGLSFIVKRN